MSYTESGSLPTGVSFNSTTGAFSGTPTVAGSYPFTVTATNPYGTSTAGNFTLVVNPNIGAPTKVVFSAEPPTTGTAGSVLSSFTVSVEDANGNVETGSNTGNNDTINLTVATGPGTIASGASATASGGVATFSSTILDTAGSYTFTATDGSRSLATATSTPPTVISPTTPSKVVFSAEPPSTGTAGSALSSFTASVEDTYSNVETGSNTGHADTINLTVATGPGTIASGASATASGGVATFSSTILDTAGSYTFTATDGTHSIATATSTPPTVIAPASGSQFVLTPATGSPNAGAGDNLTITAEDTYGNTITTYTGSHNLTFGGASAIGSFTPTVSNSSGTPVAFGSVTAINFVSGQATISSSSNGVMTLYKAGSTTITVTDGGSYNNGAGTTVTVNPATPNKVVFSTAPPTSGTAATALSSFAASVEDTYGNVETGSNTGNADSITLSVATGPGTIASGASATASGGVATFNSTILDTAGSYTFTATDGSRSIATATSTAATVIAPGVPNKVVFSTAPPTTGTAATALSSFTVSVEDANGNVETGSNTGNADTINLTVATGPGTIASGASATASGGVATFSSTILDTAGSYTFKATDGSRSITTATSTAATVIAPGTPTQVVFSAEPPTTGTAGSVLSSFTVSVEDANGNVETGSNTGNNDTINLTVATGPGTIASGASATASGGVATFSSTILDTAGSYTFTATDGSRSLATATSTPPTVISPTTPSKVVFSAEPPSTGTAGSALSSFTASVEDTYSNVETGSNTGHADTINLTVATGPGTIASGASATASGGVATFSSTILDTAGSYTFTATDGTHSIATATSTPPTVIAPASGSQFVLTPATGSPNAGAGDNLTITAEDTYGNTITTYTGSHNLTFGGASAIGSFTPTVSNSSGTPVAFGSVTAINFVSGQATISSSSNGVMTLYKAGSTTITVTDGGSYNNGAGTTVTVNPATPNKVVFSTAPPTSGTAATALSSFAASVEDTYGNVETGSNTGNADTINLTVATGPGTIASGASATASGGVATFNSTILDTAGSYTFTATDGSRSIATATSTAATVIAPGVPNKVVFSTAPPTTGTAATALSSFTVSVEDANGNVETGSNTGNADTINLTVATGPGTIASGASATASGGVATFSSTILDTAGSYTFKATDGSRSITTATSTAATVIAPGTPTKVVFSAEPPTTGTAGSVLSSFTVSVEDANGNVETGSNTGNNDTINLTVATGPGTIASGASATASGGVATFSSTILDTAGSYTFTATDGSRSLATATSTPPTVISPTTPSKVVFSAELPSTGTAGSALSSFTASVEDTYSNVETGSNTGHADTINLTVATGPGTIASGASATASGGVATFSSTILDTAGSYTFTATDGTHSIATATSTPPTVIAPASGSQFVLTPATGSPNAGAGDNLTITAEDTYGNTITTYTGSHNLTFGGASAIGSFTPTVSNSSGTPVAFGSVTAINFVSGQATISSSSNGVMTLYKAGSTTITVTDGGSYNNGAGTTVTVNPATPNKVVFSTAPPTSGTAATALSSFAASVEDTYGNVETGSNTGNADSITLSVATGPGTIASGASATASGGVATFNSTILDTAGSYTFTATDGSRSIATATSTAATVIAPGVPNKVVFSTAPPTTGTAATALSSFTVSVEDANGNVETGSNTGNADTINLTVATGPGTIASGASATASGGVATFSSTILDTAGSYTFKATDGSRSITTATSTAATVIAPGTPTQVVFSAEPPTTGTAGSVLSSFTVSVEDANGNVETGSNTGNNDTINLTVATGPGTIASGASATASGGVATFSSTILDTAGSYTFTATDGSRSLATATSTPPTVISPTTPSKVVFSAEPPSTGTAGSALSSFTASVEDTYSNVETGSNTGHADTINLTVATGPGTIASGASATASGGVATFSSTILDTAGSYTFTATDGTHSIATATSTPPTVIAPASGSQFVLTPATGSPNAGAGDNLTITAEDTYGNTITTYTGSHNLTFGGASAIGSFTPTVSNSSGTPVAFGSVTAINFVSGQATISSSSNGVMTLYKAGSTTITVTDGGSYNNGAGTTVTVNPAGAADLVIVQQPSNTFTGSTISPAVTVQVEDGYGNAVSDNGLSVTLSPSANTIASGATASTDSSGLATFSSVTIDTAAVGLTLMASANGVSSSAASSTFNVTVLVSNGLDALTDTASDAGSGVASVAYYYCPGLSGTCASSTPWTGIGVSHSGPTWAVSWTGQPNDGQYRVVAVGTDNVGNVSTPISAVPVTVDNTAPSTSVTFPVSGSYYNASGWTNGGSTPCGQTSAICGQATDSNGITGTSAISLTISQGSLTWNGTAFASGTNSVHPSSYNATSGLWVYSFANTKLTNGDSYTVSVSATDEVGNTSSPVSSSFTYDTTAPAGASIVAQPNPKDGKPDASDKAVFTYNSVMSASSILSGWSGTSTNVYAQFTRVSGSSTVMTICTSNSSCTGSTLVNLGTVSLGDPSSNRYISAGTTVYDAATLSMATVSNESVVTLTFTATAGSWTADTGSTTWAWTPSSNATDLAGNASGTTPVDSTSAENFQRASNRLQCPAPRKTRQWDGGKSSIQCCWRGPRRDHFDACVVELAGRRLKRESRAVGRNQPVCRKRWVFSLRDRASSS